MSDAGWQPANWTAPAGVRAGCTTRLGGVSRGPYRSLNLAAHVGDSAADPQQNRARIAGRLVLPAEPLWLTQTHSNRVVAAADARGSEADAVVADRPGQVCAILTADCVPVLFCHTDTAGIAAAHVGWRGLCNGILENTLRLLRDSPAQWQAWIGPHICGRCYEVGVEVREAALGRYPGTEAAFTANADGRWQLDLATLITWVLTEHGIATVSHDGSCTYEDAERFFSYRRDGPTGRMASFIWMDAGNA